MPNPEGSVRLGVPPIASIGIAMVLVLLASPNAAIGEEDDDLDTERTLAEQIDSGGGRGIAVLPDIGYSPSNGGKIGLKLAAHGVPPAEMSVDLAAGVALKGQQKAGLSLTIPSLWDGRLVGVLEAQYRIDPTKEFFGLGNNEQGPDELSTHEEQVGFVYFTLGGRPIPRLTLAATAGYREVDIRFGRLEDPVPSTRAIFPNIAGVNGGNVNPLSFSIVYNSRQDIARPSRGWTFLAKAQHVNRSIGNDFDYTLVTADASYLFPLVVRRQVIGFRLNGQYLDGGRRDVPFFELASLGGSRYMRGYFDDRFLGRARLVANAEYRLKLVDFNFYDIWFVQIDGVLFGDAGRVFMSDNDVTAAIGCPAGGGLPLPLPPAPPACPIPPTEDDFRFSWGGGTRIALGEALVARIEVGFSEEELGLTYLTFGHSF